MTRRRFTEKDVIRTLLHQGVEIRDYRTGEQITLENVDQIEREHLHEIALGGPDEPANCRYSLGESHSTVTNGTPATSAGSSKNRIAKATQPNRIEKFKVRKIPLDELPETYNGIIAALARCRKCGEYPDACECQQRQVRSGFGGLRK